MGAKQSKLKKELVMLKEQAALAKTKHDAEVEALKSDKRELQFKLSVLQELYCWLFGDMKYGLSWLQTAQAQLEAEKATLAALESEECMKALEWELVRKLTVSTSSSPTTSLSLSASSHSAATSLAASESASPRVALNWKLRDGMELRRSASTKLSTDSKFTVKAARPHAQSEPAMPHKQTLTRQEPPPKSKPQDSEKEQGDARSDAKLGNDKPSSSRGNDTSNNNEEKQESETATTVLQSISAPSSSPSSEDESRSKYPALSRKKSTQGLDAKAAVQKHEERNRRSRMMQMGVAAASVKVGGKQSRGLRKIWRTPEVLGNSVMRARSSRSPMTRRPANVVERDRYPNLS